MAARVNKGPQNANVTGVSCEAKFESNIFVLFFVVFEITATSVNIRNRIKAKVKPWVCLQHIKAVENYRVQEPKELGFRGEVFKQDG